MGRCCWLKPKVLRCLIRVTFVTALLSVVIGLVLVSMTFDVSKYPVYWAIPKFARSAGHQLKVGGSKTKPTTTYLSNKTLISRVRFNTTQKLDTSVEHKILWYNKPVWINIERYNNFLTTACPYRNCIMSTDINNLQNSKAIVFTITQPMKPIFPPINSSSRNPYQVWIFFGLESPIHSSRLWFRHYSWHNTFNWSMSYRTDADVFFPYGVLVPKFIEDISHQTGAGDGAFKTLFSEKTGDVAWIVSNCVAPSARDTYVEEMKETGLLQIDIFGSCTEHVFSSIGQLRQKISTTYKFYLSFENSFCVDYVTEKFFRYYEWDVIPVVRGGADYKRLLPPDTFIDASDFLSPRALVEYLKLVGSSVELFTKYMKNKAKYRVVHFPDNAGSVCQLCEKLNNMADNRKSYVDHVTYIHGDMCWLPDDYSYHLGFEALIIVIFFPGAILCCVFAVKCIYSNRS